MKEIKTWRKFIPGLAFPKGEDCFVIGREIRPTPLVAVYSFLISFLGAYCHYKMLYGSRCKGVKLVNMKFVLTQDMGKTLYREVNLM